MFDYILFYHQTQYNIQKNTLTPTQNGVIFTSSPYGEDGGGDKMNLEKLRGEIYANFKTQISFAQALNWNQNKVSLLMNNKYIPRLEEVELICDILDLSPELIREIFLTK